MNSAKNFVKVLSLSSVVCISGCLSEPKVIICQIEDGVNAHCYPVNMDQPEFDIPVTEMTGYFCESAEHFGEMKKHHMELHEELEKKKKD